MARKAYLKEAAKALGIHEYTLRMMAKSGEIPCWKTGNRFIFDIEQCDEFLNNKAMSNVKSIKEENKQYGKLRKVDA